MYTPLLRGLGDFNILTHHSRWLLLRFKYSTKTKTKVDDYLCELTENVGHPENNPYIYIRTTFTTKVHLMCLHLKCDMSFNNITY